MKEYMLTSEFFKKWYAAFAPQVDRKIMRERVTADGCCPWHIFTWGKVGCLSGEEAIGAYQKEPDGYVYCYAGQDYQNGLCEVVKNDLAELTRLKNTGDELYIAALDLSWTFVWTHEELFGPYFLRR